MKLRLCVTFLLLCIAFARADEPPNLLRNNDFAGGLQDWFLKGADRVKSEAVLATHEKFSRALRLDVTPQAKDMPWSVVFRQTIGAPLQKGKQLTLKVWLRSPEQVQVTAFVEGAAAPYPKTLLATLTLSSQWQEYEIKSECTQNFGPGAANCGFYLAHGKGSVRIADVRLFHTDKTATSAPPTPPTEAPKADPPKSTKPAIEPPKPAIVEPAPPAPEKPAPVPVEAAQPEAIFINGDFTEELIGWTLAPNTALIAKVNDVAPDELPAEITKVLQLTNDPAAGDVRLPPQNSLTHRIAASVERGNGLSLKFWARGTQLGEIGLQIGQQKTPGAVMRAQVSLSPKWKEFEVRSVASVAAEAATLQLTIWKGAPGTVEIADIRLQKLSVVPPGWADVQPTFDPQNLFRADDFTGAAWDPNARWMNQNLAGWNLQRQPGVTPEVVDVEAGPYRRGLRLTFDPPDPQKPLMYGMLQAFRSPPLTTEVFALKFWARSTENCSLQVWISQYEKRAPVPPGERPPPSVGRTALQSYINLTPTWHEYVIRPNALILKQMQQKPMTSDNGTCIITFRNATGVVELTGIRLALELPAEP